MTRRQVYLAPTVTGWAALVYGDDSIPDDTLVPLPLTTAVPYDDAMAFLAETPLGQDVGGVTDGWPTIAEVRECGEHDLAERLRAGEGAGR